VKEIRAALAFTSKIGAAVVACRVLRVAGSMRTLKPAALKAFRSGLLRATQGTSSGELSDERRDQMEAQFLDSLRIFEF
jgi:hypothetical protein